MGKLTTVQQYQPLRVPPSWGAKERQLIVQLESTFDDIYRRFGRLKLSDLSAPLAGTITSSETNVNRATEDITALQGRVGVVAGDLNVVSDRVSVVSDEVNILAGDVAIVADNLKFKAAQSSVDAMGVRLSQAEIDIDGLNAEIKLLATTSSIEGLTTRVSKAEIDIDGANAAIALKAEQTTVDAMGQRISAAELLIDGQNSLIAAKADKVRVEAIETEITGLLKVQDLRSEIATLAEIGVNDLVANSVNTFFMSADDIATDSLRVDGYDFTSHSHTVTVNSDGTITLGEVSSSGGSFNIADTKFYKDGVAAAKEEGARLVNVSNMFGSEGVITAQLSNGKEGTLQLSQGTASGKEIPILGRGSTVMTVNASGIYDEGYTAGEDSVTLSSSGWSNNVNTITASNGKTMKVTRYYRTANTVSSGDTVFVSYNGAMVNATYRSGGSTLTYISSVAVE